VPAPQRLGAPSELPDRSAAPPARRATVSLLVDGWPDDVRACLDGVLAHLPDGVGVQVLDLGDVDGAGAAVDGYARDPRLEVFHVAARPAWRPDVAGGAPTAGWGPARRALLRADPAAVHVWCEVSTILPGDALTPLLTSLEADDSVAAAGWRGVDVDLADQWRSFVPAGPGEVDALLGYLFAMRRELALAAGGPDRKARYYRNADMEFSFRLREAARAGGGAGRLVVPAGDLPVEQARHHGYHDVDPELRERESGRNYLRFLQRYRGREDLLAPRG
jgi:hypothetical protein